MSDQTQRAYRQLYAAERARRSSGTRSGLMARNLEADARSILAPVPALASCGEAVPASSAAPDDKWFLRETLEHPTLVTTEASAARMERALEAGVFDLALDASQSIGAANSIEKMLAHQMAAAHDSAMRLFARAAREEHPVEAARLSNAAARVMDAYKEALLALHKVRTGGKQTVVVQHVQVGDGGQAVIAGQIDRVGKNGDAGS